MTERSERAGGSEYLECNGLERFVVTYVSRFPSMYKNHRPLNTQKLCVQELVDDVNKNACPTTFDEIQGVVKQCLQKGWIEWATTEDSGHIIRRTDRGRQACGYGPDGNDARPEPTIADPKAAIRIILQILYEAKHDPHLRYRGDPRVRDRAATDSDLYTWARHHGVSRDAWREAETECLGEGFIVATPCLGGAWCRITSRGEQFLRCEPEAETPTAESIPNRARKAGEQYRQAAEALGASDPTDREVYDQFASAMETSGERAEVPTFATWQRNLREFRRRTGQQKNRPRAGREGCARGLVRVDQIECEHLPSRIRPKHKDE